MINFNYETEFTLDNEQAFSDWLSAVIVSEDKNEGEINYIFCDDEYLHKINVEYLNHDTLTDIMSFDYTVVNELNVFIFVSVEIVEDNATVFYVSFEDELKRVLAHGILHYCGYKDNNDNEAELMRSKEDEKIAMFHVEQ